MATKRFYATGSFRYGTRMLKAGDPVDLDGPNARLFTALKKISPNKPKGATAPTPPVAPAPERKAAPRKRARKAKK